MRTCSRSGFDSFLSASTCVVVSVSGDVCCIKGLSSGAGRVAAHSRPVPKTLFSAKFYKDEHYHPEGNPRDRAVTVRELEKLPEDNRHLLHRQLDQHSHPDQPPDR